MKTRLVVLIVLAAAALAIASRVHGATLSDNYEARDESNGTFQLAPGAAVSVSGINGPVEIQTISGSTAEVQIIRTARTQEDLQHRKVTMESTGGGLTIRGDNDHSDARVRQHVILRATANIALGVHGVNGAVTVGAIEGPVEITGINGHVNVAQASEYSRFNGINGQISIAMSSVGQRGIHMSGINGNIEIKMPAGVNADLNVSGINGTVYSDLSNVTIQGKWGPRQFNARIGSGGAPITITGINGQITIHGS